MIKFFLYIGCFLLLFLSCKTLSLNQVYQKQTTQQVTLGSIGLGKKVILQKEFNNTSIPTYITPIKISLQLAPFNNQTFKAFTKANALQMADVTINYIDSIKTKPNYVKLQIADKVSVINALNNEENSKVKKYLSYNKKANILTSISMAFHKNNLEAIIKADAVFLVEKRYKTYALQLYKAGVKTQTIFFNEGVVFGFKGSSCCWKENNRHQIDIVDIVSQFNNCPNKTYRSAKRAEKKVSTINF